MPRPLMQHGVDQLATLFTNSKTDLKVLKQLEHELQYRHVPRAFTLLAEVQAAMYDTTPATPPVAALTPLHARAPAPRQPTLWEPLAEPPPVTVTPPAVQPRPATPAFKTPEMPAVAKPSQPPAPTMPLEDAYKLLKATAGSSWESIEQTRRQLVQQSQPGRLRSMSADRRGQTLAEAKRVNAAYAALSQARCGGR